MFGRVFVNVLFWQQAAVLEDVGVLDSLRRSREIAQSRRELPWWQRPVWRGVILSSLWCLFATALSIGSEWSTLAAYYHSLTTMSDPQSIIQSMTASGQTDDALPLAGRSRRTPDDTSTASWNFFRSALPRSSRRA